MIKLRLHGTMEELGKFDRYLYKLEAKGEIEVLTNSEVYADRGQSKYYRKYLDISVNEMPNRNNTYLDQIEDLVDKQLKKDTSPYETFDKILDIVDLMVEDIENLKSDYQNLELQYVNLKLKLKKLSEIEDSQNAQ